MLPTPELHMNYDVVGLYQAICLTKEQNNLAYASCARESQALYNSILDILILPLGKEQIQLWE